MATQVQLPFLARHLLIIVAQIIVATAACCVCAAADGPVEDSAAVDQPLPPEIAAESMIVPDGFQVTLFAGEPDVRQPVGFCMDDRGRLWVAEAYHYPNHTTEPGDRIVIFEDTDHDGRFDQRTVFFDQLNYVTGIEVGFGGAWVMSPPYFYFIPDRNGDDIPDAAPQVLLDGFGTHANAHNLANGFAWGPDGWLYGTHGRTNWSMVGLPGTPDEQRTRYDGGVYRYHPVRHEWEGFTDGTTNPWGVDWDDYGQAFICNCVNPHLFHAIQGAHYEPWRNRRSSEFAYERIPTIADHLHFAGVGNVRDALGTPEEDRAGGGHAHCGTMVYLGDNWPDRYRNTVFMNNIHGRRINNDLLQRKGSGYTAAHGDDLMKSADPWFMGVTLTYGFDGSVFVSDWSDTGECHSVRNTRRQTGRIYRISFGHPDSRPVNIAVLSDEELVQLHLHRNDRFVRHARRVLQERKAAGADLTSAHALLRRMFDTQTDVTRKLRAMWTLHATQGLNDQFLTEQLAADSEYIRAWAVQLLCEDKDPPADALQQFQDLAESGTSQLVRLYLASALQRLTSKDRWPLAEALATRGEDSDDDNLPLMLWYGVEPLIADDLPRYARLAEESAIPLVRRHVARRIVGSDYVTAGLPLLVNRLPDASDEAKGDILQGILTGMEGRRSYPMPAAWPTAYAALKTSVQPAVRAQALRLALIFDDPAAITFLRQQAIEAPRPAEERNAAIKALVSRKVPGLEQLLFRLLNDPATVTTALAGLSEYNHPGTVKAVLGVYDKLNAAARQQALQTLASRRVWAEQLVTALGAGSLPRQDITAYTARQLLSLGDPDITARVRRVWGDVRVTSDERRQLIERTKRRLTPTALQNADLSSGRALFQKHCASCHRLFGSGGRIGPDITGAQRMNIDYMLENLIDPSAAVSRDFQMEIVVTTAGRVITGLVADENPRAVTIQTATERIVIPSSEVESRQKSDVSMMPEGQLKLLSSDEVRDLLAYLASPKQVPLPSDQ